MSTLATIPFHGTQLVADHNDGNPLVALKPACESIGLAYSKQLQKLKAKTWATVSLKATVGADGKSREMAMIDRRTLTMWLATIEPSRVSAAIRPTLEAFQNEAADALDAYFHEGGAINPNATEEQLDKIIRQSDAQLSFLAKARGMVDRNWLEGKTRLVIARGLGEAPEIPAAALPLYVEDYLNERKCLKAPQVKALRSTFGRKLAAAYREAHGRSPQKAPGDVGSRIRSLNMYIEADRWLFEKVWSEDYAELFELSLFEEVSA